MPAGLLGMFEAEDFRVQGLPREINARIWVVRSAKSRVVSAVADQGQSGVRSLGSDLMFSAGFQTEPQFGDDTFAAGQRVLGDDFVMGDGFAGLVSGGPAAVEVGTETFDVTARVTEGAEREKYWTKQKQDYPGFADYEEKTTREIPVVVLERAG